ncbi:MAG: hypothetical protein QXY20_09485 [Thermofilum sp.]|uniref:hypothetical protein n=1 Tax=Thermofilum sp. TaxID=1961369 RepID=UPI0031635CA7
MQNITQNPTGAGVNAPKLGPRQIWALKTLYEKRGLYLYRDEGLIPLTLEELYMWDTKSHMWAPYNVTRIVRSLQKKGLVEVKRYPCPNPDHGGRLKKFVFVTPEGEKALRALQK